MLEHRLGCPGIQGLIDVNVDPPNVVQLPGQVADPDVGDAGLAPSPVRMMRPACRWLIELG
jgi:hypothetical protein